VPRGSHKADPGTAIATPGDESTFTVSLPVPVHETPEEEAALAIADVPIVPVYLDSAAPTTTSISVIPDRAMTVPDESIDPGTVIPALPESDDVSTRRPRARKGIATAPETPEPPKETVEPKPAGKRKQSRKKARERKQAPEGLLQALLYTVTFHLANVGDSYAVRQRKALEARISRQFDGTQFVALVSRKGGVGTTTIAALTAMAMADVRADRVIGIDANPDRGTFADRITKTTTATIRDVVTQSGSIASLDEFEALVSRDETSLDVLASDTDPLAASPFGQDDYNVVADIAERYYAIAVTDPGSGIVYPATTATLQRANAAIIVSGGSVDEARSASDTLTWLESNGHADLVSNAVLALNTATQGTNLDKIEEIEAHFAARVREIVRIPYDPMLATGSVIHYRQLQPITREAARDLAAIVLDGVPSPVDA
jgi:MinD-like ATPase involved in chromosome partitioning or flagellar assembly